MHCFFCPALPQPLRPFTLSRDESDHAARVLRVQAGDEIGVLDGHGTRVVARVLGLDRAAVKVEPIKAERAAPPPAEITLFQAITKPKSMEWIVEKATELGVARIQPLVTEHVVPRFRGGEEQTKTGKWHRKAVEALKQCGNPWLPVIEKPQPFAGVVEASRPLADHVVAIVPSVARSTHQDRKPWTLRANRPPARLGLWIGPEGDFSGEELEVLLSAGAHPITIGDNVLRSETATVSALAIVCHELHLALANETSRARAAAPA